MARCAFVVTYVVKLPRSKYGSAFCMLSPVRLFQQWRPLASDGLLGNHRLTSLAWRLANMTARMDLCDLIVSMEQAEISPRPVVGAIIVVSGVAISFLLWLLYVHHASADFAGRWMFLPALNALLNGLCAIALCVGLYFIKHHNREAHRTSMLLAFAFSSAFLISYIVNHALHGDTIFPGHGPVRTLYLSILASHVILSVVALPM